MEDEISFSYEDYIDTERIERIRARIAARQRRNGHESSSNPQ